MRKQHELHPLSSPNFFRFFFLAVGRHLALLKIFRPPVTHSLYSTRPALHSAAHVAACLPSLPQPRRPFFGISSVAVTDLGSATKMPTGYRIELAPNQRATCKNTECKNAGVKILKGEVRFATMITINEHSSWTYKHWGCVTPKVIGNVKEYIAGDMSMLDGFEELPEDLQVEIEKAFEQGHVDDADWKGDVEKNRPGQNGFRLTKADKKRLGIDEDEDGTKKKSKKRAHKDEEEEEEAPAPKKARGKKNVKAKNEEQDEEEEAPAPKKARGRKAKQVKAEEVDSEENEIAADEEEAPAPKKARGKKAKQVKTEEADSKKNEIVADEEEEAPAP